MSIRVLVSSLCLVLVPGLSQALVNAGNPGGNLTAPTGQDGQPTDPGFANVLMIRGGTGVYLGNGWVLTARHVVPAWVMVGGVKLLRAEAVDQEHAFKNAELRLFHLKDEPDLPAMRIAASSPTEGTPVVMAGAGRPSQDHISYWQVVQSPNAWTWTQLPGPDGANAAGITCKSGQQLSWGTNRVSARMPNPKLGNLLVTDFSQLPAESTPFEAQAAQYDSGGPFFVQTDKGWEVCGIMATVARLYPDQPGVIKPENSNVLSIQSGFFGNLTLAVDLAPYRDEILEITGLDDE